MSSRFEEMDAVVIFDNVLVPWERIFMYGQPELCNRAFADTNAVVHMAHQVACGKLAKAEFLTGILCAIAKATGRDKDLAMKGMISEIMMMTETVRALLYQAEHVQPDITMLLQSLSSSLFQRSYPSLLNPCHGR